jgi:hypothetical protein
VWRSRFERVASQCHKKGKKAKKEFPALLFYLFAFFLLKYFVSLQPYNQNINKKNGRLPGG